eukprot:TRINITY_DN9335_c0_g1_i2.p1 TRINITY_DN9335_c0_g1~~TRINITY_DN9335_c0_g1_i2.p1  ORF type:complete len:739 (+),score=99.42 TRINITY_DN9335_c0_g1_i2:81-2219(+)
MDDEDSLDVIQLGSRNALDPRALDPRSRSCTRTPCTPVGRDKLLLPGTPTDEEEGGDAQADGMVDLLSRQLAETQGVLSRHYRHAARLSTKMDQEFAALQAQNATLRERLQDGVYVGSTNETPRAVSGRVVARSGPYMSNVRSLHLDTPSVREADQVKPLSREKSCVTSTERRCPSGDSDSDDSAELLDNGCRITRIRPSEALREQPTNPRNGVRQLHEIVPSSPKRQMMKRASSLFRKSAVDQHETGGGLIRGSFLDPVQMMFRNDPQQLEQPTKPRAGAVFADAAIMKEKVRMAIGRPEYNVCNFYHDVGFWQAVARSRLFENTTLAVISFNAIWIAVDTDHNEADLLINAHPVFQAAENFFCLYFFVEWLSRFMAFRYKRDGFRDYWFIFDTVLMVVMVMETWFFTFLFFAVGNASGGGALGNAGVLKLFRLVRLSRMARMARAMPELMIMIKGMFVAMRSVFFTLCLLLCIVYVFAIAFVQLMGPRGALQPLSDKWILCNKGKLMPGQATCTSFPTVLSAMNSLLIGGTLADQETLIEGVGVEHPLMRILIMIYILLAGLTVMNMLVGVLCEVVSVVSAVEKEALLVGFVKDQLQQMLISTGIDADNNDNITKLEFDQLMEKPEAARALQEVGVDVVGLVELTDFIFQDGRALTFCDFMDIILQLRGSNTATVKDIVDLRKLVLQEFSKLSDQHRNSGRSSLTSAMSA